MIERSHVFSKHLENVYDKIEKTDYSKFRNVSLDEVQKLITMCKTEQNMGRKYNL